MPEIDVKDLKVSIGTALTVGAIILSTAVSGLSVYFGLKSEIADLKNREAALERNIQELTVTLKLKGVIQ